MRLPFPTRSPEPVTASAAPVTTPAARAWGVSARPRALSVRLPRPELAGLIVLAGLLNTWALARNGWANLYYSAAVRSMSASWHDFLFASLDRSGVMTVDKPPLALWVQALSVRVFGYHPLSVLLPQALMGVASVVLVYDLVRRRFGRAGGFVAGLALALTPITVAISRHNNPDALLVLCCVAALWCAVRALEDRRTRWLVLAGVCVGLGFETKMGVALTVVPGIAAAWLWTAPRARERLRALRALFAGATAMVLVGGAWPALVELTPAADRPWVSGTSDNRILSLIFGYNGLGRVDGQTGGPGGGGGNMFGGNPGPLRLLNAALGGQAGWLLGFALFSGLLVLVSSRLRRGDARTGWLVAVGGAFATTALLFSFASGIFHPYYVSLLAPFTAALVGAGFAELISARPAARILGPLALAAGVAAELAVRGNYPGQLGWLPAVLPAVAVPAAILLTSAQKRRTRALALAAGLAALLLAPAAWAVDTLSYATSGTFPAGGPASVQAAAGGPGGGASFGVRHFGGAGLGRLRAEGGPGAVPLFGPAGPPVGAGGTSSAGSPPAPPAGASPPGVAGTGAVGVGAGRFAPGGGAGFGGGRPGLGAFGGAFGGSGSLESVLSYVKAHGGGTIAVASQSSAASAIVDGDADVAGIGGFSGRESAVSVAWLAQQVSAGKIRWVLAEGGGAGAGGPALPGDTRTGSKAAIAAVTEVCRAVAISNGTSAGSGSASGAVSAGTLYDCQGRAAALRAA